MDFGKFDILVLTTMSLAIILMSLTFPALGMTDSSDTQNASDVPEFNVSASSWDIAGDFPESPGTPTQGKLVWNADVGNSVEGRSLEWLDRPKDEGLSIEAANTTSGFDLLVLNWNGSGNTLADDRYSITSEGQTILHDNASWVIEFEVTELDNYRQPNMTAEIEYEVLESEQSGGGLSAIPVIGPLFGAGEALASGIVWIGEVIWWLVAFTFDIAVALITILAGVMVYGVDMLVWLSTTYSDVVSAAGSWASVILMVPAILLFAEFAKIGMIGIKLLPFT